MTEKLPQIPLSFIEYSVDEMKERSEAFTHELSRRRTVRDFSSRPVPRIILENCIKAAASAPSGANRQPWHFVLVENPETKAKIRTAAEAEEEEFYRGMAPQEWIDAVEPLGTNEEKPFLETAPYLIAVFAERIRLTDEQRPEKNYYVSESVGIATGFLIASLHHAGLATLTHTPCPMKFLNQILEQPNYRRPYLILVVGYPSEDATVPEIEKKAFEQVVTRF